MLPRVWALPFDAAAHATALLQDRACAPEDTVEPPSEAKAHSSKKPVAQSETTAAQELKLTCDKIDLPLACLTCCEENLHAYRASRPYVPRPHFSSRPHDRLLTSLTRLGKAIQCLQIHALIGAGVMEADVREVGMDLAVPFWALCLRSRMMRRLWRCPWMFCAMQRPAGAWFNRRAGPPLRGTAWAFH